MNRTTMELKLLGLRVAYDSLEEAMNRTTMELKRFLITLVLISAIPMNRTTMELKDGIATHYAAPKVYESHHNGIETSEFEAMQRSALPTMNRAYSSSTYSETCNIFSHKTPRKSKVIPSLDPAGEGCWVILIKVKRGNDHLERNIRPQFEKDR